MVKPEIIESKTAYSGTHLTVRADRMRYPGGKETIYEHVERDNSVVIIPLTPTRRTVLLNQFRYPTQMMSLELPMGGIDAGETKKKAAERELEEETRIKAKDLQHIGTFYPVPGLTSQSVDVFVAKVSDEELNKATIDSAEPDIEGLSVVSLPRVFDMVAQGEISEGFTLSSLLLLKLYLERNEL